MANNHAQFSPSAAERWIACPGSLELQKLAPTRARSEAADLGTAKHKLSEQCLRECRDAVEWLGQTVLVEGAQGFLVDTEFAAHVQQYVDAIRQRVGHRLVEVRLDTSRVIGVPEQFGTADCIVIDRARKTLEVHDAKFGWNRVMADCAQLKIYAAAALEQFAWYADIDTVECWIHQPPIDHEDRAAFTPVELRAFSARVTEAALTASAILTGKMAIEGHLHPSSAPWCEKWCPARAICPARAAAVVGMFEAAQACGETRGAAMDAATLGAHLACIQSIEAWCADIRESAMQRASAGETIPGWKLVSGRKGNRIWKDEPAAAAQLTVALGDACYAPRKLVSPAVADKLLGKAEAPKYADLWTAPDGKPTLVPEADPRQPINGSAIQFDTLTTGDPQ